MVLKAKYPYLSTATADAKEENLINFFLTHKLFLYFRHTKFMLLN